MTSLGKLRTVHYIWTSLLAILAVFAVSVWFAEWESTSLLPWRAPEGKRLAQRYCGACHLYVSPSALDKETWADEVLPAMAPRTGLEKLWGKYYPDPYDSTGVSVSVKEWEKIVGYYSREAPDTIRAPGPPSSLQTDLPLFAVRKPETSVDRRAATTMVAVDDSTQHIYSSNTVTESIYRWGRTLDARTTVQTGLLGVSIRFLEGSERNRYGVFTSIGATMQPNDRAKGEVLEGSLENDSSRVIVEGLPRPVRSVPGDFNQDGLRDWIVCGFGYNRGGLYLVEQQSDGSYEKRELRNAPGAVDAHVEDFNQDGYPDVMVLFGQGNEGVWLFMNDRNGGFDRRNVLRFPPVYGSTNFQLVDFNGDDKLDILYVSGDNADHSRILKPYHGIYIFINQGDFQFEQSYFYHFNGATEAIAADFDGDGDLDISAIAFFAGLKDDSAYNFVYLEQQEGGLKFLPYAPSIQQYGRWLSMDAGDYDGDSDLDLVLGNFNRSYVSPGGGGASASNLPFIVLENQLHR